MLFKNKIISNSGFTLIEMALVLIIIGLLVGTILTGQTLVAGAQVHNQLKQVQDLELAIMAFKGKYDCLPGDCANATSFFGTTDAAGYTIVNGDGDGRIRVATGQPTTADCVFSTTGGEVLQLFLHLNDANMGTYTSDGATPTAGIGFPLLNINNKTGMFVTCLGSSTASAVPKTSMAVGNIIVVGACAYANTRIQYALDLTVNGGSCNGASPKPEGIPITMAQSIDQKIDDGLPNTGNFASIASTTSGCYSSTNLYSAIPAPPGCWEQVGFPGNIIVGKKLPQ